MNHCKPIMSCTGFPRKRDVKIKMCGRKMIKRQRPNHCWEATRNLDNGRGWLKNALPMVGVNDWKKLLAASDAAPEFLVIRIS